MSAVNDLIGRRFGLLTVEERAKSKNGRAQWRCTCDCGSEWIGKGNDLCTGHVKSCGCLNKTHGETKTRMHRAWSGMLTRVLNKNTDCYKDYGGRGICVAEEFKKYTVFRDYLLSEFGRALRKGESIDRIDNDKGYVRGNIRYATHTEQNRNRRNNHIVNVFGQEMPLSEAVEKYGAASYDTIQRRINFSRWPVEEALLTKPRPHARNLARRQEMP